MFLQQLDNEIPFGDMPPVGVFEVSHFLKVALVHGNCFHVESFGRHRYETRRIKPGLRSFRSEVAACDSHSLIGCDVASRTENHMSNVIEEPRPAESAGLAKFVLAAILVVAIPLFIRTPLTTDAIYYDLQARHLVEGGKLYEDMFEPNLPGVVWLHVAVRSIAGDSWEALRVFDLLMFSAAVIIAVGWIVPKETPRPSRYYLASACYLFYFSQTTWCHCQRDVWMLVPVLGALALRMRQVDRIRTDATLASTIFGFGVIEGLVWGAGVWLKPHVLLMAGFVWFLSGMITRQWRRIAVDAGGMLFGGIAIGGVGVAWMLSVGCWPAFWETMTQWNPEYAANGQAHKTFIRYARLAYFMSPWIWLHLVAVPCACVQIARCCRGKQVPNSGVALIAICYLVWTLQAFLLQHLFHYVHVAPILLAGVVILSSTVSWSSSVTRFGFVGFATIAILCSPLLKSERLAHWWESIRSPVSWEVGDQLAGTTTDRQLGDIERVAQFLEGSQVGRQDVWCYNSELVAIYDRLNLIPPARYVYTLELLVFLPSRRQEIMKTYRETPARYLVANVTMSLIPAKKLELLEKRARQSASGAQPPDADFGLPYPWNQPVVYTAGNYYVFDLGAKPQTLVSDRSQGTLQRKQPDGNEFPSG